MKVQSLKIVAILLFLVIGWVFRPFIHPLIMSFVISPLRILQIAIIIWMLWILFSRTLWPKIKVSSQGSVKIDWQDGTYRKVGLIVGVLILISLGLTLESDIRASLTAHQITYEKREQLPEFNPLRLTPKGVAQRYAQDSFQNPQEYLGDSQIVLIHDQLYRVFPRLPDGALLYFFNKLSGFVTVEVSTLDRTVNIEDQTFKYAEGIGIFDNLYYQLPLKRFFVTYSSEPIYLKNDTNNWVTIVPYITYKGFPFTIPTWGGVMEIKPDGTINDYTPEQAQEISYLKNNRIYPKELSEYYAQSFAYKNGILNKWFLHKDETEVVNLPSDEMVLHVPTKEGYKQMIVAEPYGRSYGIYKIFFTDATTGKREIIEYDSQSQLTGPIAAADYVKRNFPTYDWSSFSLVEPRPITINNSLNWMLSIVPNDWAGIASTVFLDTKTNNVQKADDESQIDQIRQGEKNIPNEITPTPGNTQNSQINQKINDIQQQLDELKKLLNQ
ncbi:hypothetical protein HGA91_04135 [candidate division WWE3 bacterium]|nr:hypothetical protein [candidate division WWE3 bacterium]